MTDTPAPSSPTPFFAAGEGSDAGAPREYLPAESHPFDAPLDPDPLYAPGPSAPADDSAQPALEQLLRDVRGALATLPGDDHDAPAPPTATPSAPVPTGPDVEDLGTEIAGLQRTVGQLRDSQSRRHAEITARLDALVQAAATSPATATAAAPVGGPDDVTMTDLHDGLAGVRTDVAALPDAVGPAVTSAVAHGLFETTRQLDGVRTVLTETVAESEQLRAGLASLQVTLASLHEQVSLLPQVLTGLRDATDRLGELEMTMPPSTPEPLPDIAGIVDERLADHLTAFGTGLGERLDTQFDAMHALASAPVHDEATHDDLVNDMGERLAETERRLAERLDVLRATDTSGQLGRQLEELEARLHHQLTAVSAGGDDVADQVRAAELRITQHVDEAVLALAQAVLGGRAGPSAPGSELDPASGFEPVMATPGFEPVAFEPVAFEPEVAGTDLSGTGTEPEAVDEPSPVYEPAPVYEPGHTAELDPVPVYGTDDLGLLPPAMATLHPGSDSGASDEAPVDDAGAEVTAESGEAETTDPTYSLHTVGSPVDDDPERPELASPPGDVPTTDTEQEPDAEAEADTTRRGLFRRRH